MNFVYSILASTWNLLEQSAFYILLGLLLGGIIRAFLSPQTVGKHLGGGRFSSVIKAALWGIPLPLCSCAVIPTAAALKRQGANKGALTSFLISTPETGL